MTEWKKINGFSHYSASSDGKIRNDKTNKILKPWKTKNDYNVVSLGENGVVVKRYVHRLICETFIDNPKNKPQVNHKNGNKDDNRIENLEWVTSKENHIHRSKVLGIKSTKEHMTKMINIATEINKKPVRCIETGVVYDCGASAAKHIGGNPGNLNNALRGRAKTYCGFHWEYA